MSCGTCPENQECIPVDKSVCGGEDNCSTCSLLGCTNGGDSKCKSISKGFSCNNGVCGATMCTVDDTCPSGYSCVNGYCEPDSSGFIETHPAIFIILSLILVVVLLAIAGGIGYFAYKKYKKR